MAALMLVLLGCGDALVDGHYLGEPMLIVTGEVLTDAPLDDDGDDVSVALFWTEIEPGQPARVEDAVEVQTDFPSQYTLSVFHPPPDEALHPMPEDATGVLALGVLLVYLDSDADGIFTPETEPAIGAAAETHIDWFATVPSSQPETPADTFLVGSDGLPCDPDGLGTRTEREGDADLTLGDPCTLLPDWNCDGSPDEWRDLCWGADGKP